MHIEIERREGPAAWSGTTFGSSMSQAVPWTMFCLVRGWGKGAQILKGRRIHGESPGERLAGPIRRSTPKRKKPAFLFSTAVVV